MTLARATCAVLLAGTAAALAAPSPGDLTAAKAAVQQFYEFHFKHGMAFSKKALQEREKFLDPDLYKLLLAKEAEPVPSDEVPDIEGDPFTDSQEYPARFEVGTPSARGEEVDVAVVFLWPKGGDRRAVTVSLRKGGGGWLVTNVVYGKGDDLRALAAPRTP